jgi:hypothetical protein
MAMAVLNLLGLVCSLIGGFLLFYNLTLKSSNYRLVQKSDGGVAICLNKKLVASGYGGPLVLTNDPCPDWNGTGPTAEVVAEKPVYVPWGLGLIIAGFMLQLPLAVGTIAKRN